MINILPKDLVDKIAAGEVVERPSSVVKELVENALDAGADIIKIELVDGGLTSITVSDNGSGIDKVDIPKLIVNHATSKITDTEDLYNIKSFGFRGEALASISSVSRFSIITKTKNDDVATKLTVVDGKTEIKPASFVIGTKVTVEDLFYSIPARRKFLKSDRTEKSYIIKLTQEMAIAHPEITFILSTEKGTLYTYKKQSLDERIKEILKVDFLPHEILYNTEDLQITASLVSPGNNSKQSSQLVFVNGRPVNSPIIAKSVKDAYVSYIKSDTKPSYIIFIEIDPSKVDVNVHPRKLEVKFLYPNIIYEKIFRGINEFFSRFAENEFKKYKDNAQVMVSDVDNFNDLPKIGNYQTLSKNRKVQNENLIMDSIDFSKEILKGSIEATNFTPINNPSDNVFTKKLLQIQNKFIVFEGEEGLIIVDQHAAAERINYEKFKKAFAEEVYTYMTLLFPINLNVTLSEYEQLVDHIDDFGQLGIGLVDLGNGIISVEKIIDGISPSKVQDICIEILEDIESYSTTRDKTKDKLIATLACRSSIMFGDHLDDDEMRKLITDLYNCDTPFTCAHGRPVQYILLYEKLLSYLARC